jgi:hypothetical protein
MVCLVTDGGEEDANEAKGVLYRSSAPSAKLGRMQMPWSREYKYEPSINLSPPRKGKCQKRMQVGEARTSGSKREKLVKSLV